MEPCLTDGQPWKAAIYDIVHTLFLSRTHLHIFVYNLNCVKTRYTINQTGSPVSEVYKIHLIIKIFVYCFHKIMCHARWIQRLGNVTHCANLSQPRTTIERSDAASLCSPAQVQITTPTRSPWNMDTSILWTHSSGSNSVCLECLHCTTLQTET